MSQSNTTTPPSSEKLQKVLARAGLGSRREMETAIADGRVKVNSQVAKLGDRVEARDKVSFDDRPVTLRPEEEVPRRVIMYNKPEGELCTRKDPEGRRTVFERLPRLKGERWIAIGRLDINTSGLLLFTTDGELAHRLMHPSNQIDREYAVRIFGEVDDAMIERLLQGVLLEDGMAKFTDISPAGGSGINRWFHVTLLEGRNREVRRLWESQGVRVSRLKRVRYGPIFLPSRLTVGKWEELDQRAVDTLSRTVGLEAVEIPQKTPNEKAAHDRQRRKSPGRSGKKTPGNKWAVSDTKPAKPAGRAPRPERARSKTPRG